jgi:hypothetical protein
MTAFLGYCDSANGPLIATARALGGLVFLPRREYWLRFSAAAVTACAGELLDERRALLL